MSGTLSIVATPIGNLEDMTPRAIRVLSEADMIAAEDTRNTSILLHKFEIKTPLLSNHKFNEDSRIDYFIQELMAGKNIALVSDAGTPCISDPGYLLVRAAARHGIQVTGIPGACAAVTAISISGFRADSFLFFGFIPREKKHLDEMISRAISSRTHVIVFYESPKRIQASMQHFIQALPDAEVCLCNDLSKKFELLYRGTPEAVLESLQDNPNAQKGEYTIVLQLNAALFEAPDEQPLSPEALLVEAVVTGQTPLKDAVKQLAKTSGYSRSQLYDASLRLKEMF